MREVNCAEGSVDAFENGVHPDEVVVFPAAKHRRPIEHRSSAFQNHPFHVIQTAYEEIIKLTDDYGVILAITPPRRFPRLLKLEEDFGLFIRPTVFTALGHASYVNYAQPHYNDSVEILKEKLTNCVIIPPSIYEPPKDPNILPHTHTLVCSGGTAGQYRYDPANMCGIFSNRTHALTVETEQSLKAKLCAVKAEFIDLDYGIAVYDIDADMDDSACPKVEYTGRYKRLKLLRKINDFMKSYTKKSMKKQCEKL
ncbi:uncharacterized protein [Dermacentor albipictus]|uniref:uncharacterized protein n=1 Tax=Dermacentor albipictus TaxID=60249 RepID=UPI0038FC30C1